MLALFHAKVSKLHVKVLSVLNALDRPFISVHAQSSMRTVAL